MIKTIKNWLANWLFKDKFSEVKALADLATKQIAEAQAGPKYFKGDVYAQHDQKLYDLYCDLLRDPRFKYLLFVLRESVLDEILKATGERLLIAKGHLEMISVLETYLINYKVSHEQKTGV